MISRELIIFLHIETLSFYIKLYLSNLILNVFVTTSFSNNADLFHKKVYYP